MATSSPLRFLPRFVQQTVFARTAYERTAPPLVSRDRRDVNFIGALPTTSSQANCHALDEIGGLSSHGVGKLGPPFLEKAESC